MTLMVQLAVLLGSGGSVAGICQVGSELYKRLR